MSITWSIFFLLFVCIGIRLYKVTGQKMESFLKKVRIASIWDNGEPDGWIVGWLFIGYLYANCTQNETVKTLFIFAGKQWYANNIESIRETHKDTAKLCLRYNMEGNPCNRTCIGHLEPILTLPPRLYQADIIQQIMADYEKNDVTSALLYGSARYRKINDIFNANCGICG